jgi:hypothetical protein
VPIKARKATEEVLTGGQAHSRIGETGEVGRRSDRVTAMRLAPASATPAMTFGRAATCMKCPS